MADSQVVVPLQEGQATVGSAPTCQDNQTEALGAFAGVGGGVFVTNATNVTQLGGSSITYSFNLGIGLFKFGPQLNVSGNTWLFGMTFGEEEPTKSDLKR